MVKSFSMVAMHSNVKWAVLVSHPLPGGYEGTITSLAFTGQKILSGFRPNLKAKLSTGDG